MRRSVLLALPLALLLCLLVPSLAFAADDAAADLGGGLMDLLIKFAIFIAVVALIAIIALWVIFTKAGQPGWASIVPFYNYVVMLRIVDKPIMWFILLLIPIANIIALFWWAFVFPFALAEKFGKGGGFALGLILLPIIFYPVLAFGGAEYQPEVGSRRLGARPAY